MFINLLIALYLFFNFYHSQQKPVLVKSVSVPNQVIPAPVINTPSPYEIKKLSIDNIFSDDHSWINSLPSDRKKILIATGDIIPARTVNYKTVTSGNFNWPFEKTAGILKSADFTFINLESPLIENCPLTTEGMKFCGDPRHIQGLNFAGVDVVNLANNHSGNYGISGKNNTVKLLDNAGILSAGISGPVYKNVGGSRFAFLGYNEVGFQEGISGISRENIINEINMAKSNADIVIVQFHWGVEYTTQITQVQKDLAHLSIDSGADLVIGNHPHWIQPVEIYKNKLITYAHGNFIFDQEWSQKTKEGIVGKYTFYDNELIDARFLPMQIDNYGQPYFLDKTKSKPILDELKTESVKFSSANR